MVCDFTVPISILFFLSSCINAAPIGGIGKQLTLALVSTAAVAGTSVPNIHPLSQAPQDRSKYFLTSMMNNHDIADYDKFVPEVLAELGPMTYVEQISMRNLLLTSLIETLQAWVESIASIGDISENEKDLIERAITKTEDDKRTIIDGLELSHRMALSIGYGF